MTFRNSILAGTTLVRNAIQSEGFVSGSTGWRISRNGNAEFNDGTFRGALFIGDPLDAYCEIDIEPNGFPAKDLPIIRLHSVDGELRLLLNHSGGVDTPKLEFENSAGEIWEQFVTSNNFTVRTRANYSALGRIQMVLDHGFGARFNAVDASGGGGVLVDVTDGFLKKLRLTTTLEAWTALGFIAAWGAGTVNYYKGPDGFVHMRGQKQRTAGAIVNGEAIATMPAGYRPLVAQEFVCSSPGTAGYTKVVVNTTGVIQPFTPTVETFIDFSAVSFSVI